MTQPLEDTKEFSSTGSSGTAAIAAEPAGSPSGAAQKPLPSGPSSSKPAPSSSIRTVSRQFVARPGSSADVAEAGRVSSTVPSSAAVNGPKGAAVGSPFASTTRSRNWAATPVRCVSVATERSWKTSPRRRSGSPGA